MRDIKTLSLLGIPALVLSFQAVVFSQSGGITVTVDGRPVQFTDVPGDAWYATYVRDAVQSGIVSGYRDEAGNPVGRFGPGDPVTLAQALKIAVNGAGYDQKNYDGTASGSVDWTAPFARVAESEGFRIIREQGALTREATRAEAAGLFADAFRVRRGSVAGGRYSDVGSGVPYASSIDALSRDGILSGDTDAAGRPVGRFRPLDRINRAEVTKIVLVARAVYGLPGQGRGASSTSASSTASVSSSASSAERTATVMLSNSSFLPPTLMIGDGRCTVRMECTM